MTLLRLLFTEVPGATNGPDSRSISRHCCRVKLHRSHRAGLAGTNLRPCTNPFLSLPPLLLLLLLLFLLLLLAPLAALLGSRVLGRDSPPCCRVHCTAPVRCTAPTQPQSGAQPAFLTLHWEHVLAQLCQSTHNKTRFLLNMFIHQALMHQMFDFGASKCFTKEQYSTKTSRESQNAALQKCLRLSIC